MKKRALIVQGGGFRTAFSTGVLDAFLEKNHLPFDLFVGVSGGAIALSYFISAQPRYCLESIKYLSDNKKYMDLTRLISSQAIVDIEVFYEISNSFRPFNFRQAQRNLTGKQLAIVMTDCSSGNARYFEPKTENWQDAIIASCAFPFMTKGKHMLEGKAYMDGAWSDPLPVKWAVQQGATDITLIRTLPSTEKLSKSWLDLIGEIYYRNEPGLKTAFSENHLHYNHAIDFILAPPTGVTIRQIAPESDLKAGVYTDSKDHILEDYSHGVEKGRLFLKEGSF